MKVKVKVKEIYEFEMETESDKRNNINSEIEDRWNEMVNMGLESDHYQETEFDYDEI